jgi:hypothetical protein
MPHVLYRAIRRSRPRLADFWSDFALGEDPAPSQLRETIRWTGISTFSDLDVARQMATYWTQGPFIAELRISDDADVVVAQTGRNNPTHHSVMGTPATLLSLVAQVLPIIDSVPS